MIGTNSIAFDILVIILSQLLCHNDPDTKVTACMFAKGQGSARGIFGATPTEPIRGRLRRHLPHLDQWCGGTLRLQRLRR